MITSKIQTRFNEICPKYIISDKSRECVLIDSRVAFSIIGFYPKNFDTCFDNHWNSDRDILLSDFVYKIWRCSKE